jgi:hydrogenase nickel incorporation protein HypA/HybF
MAFGVDMHEMGIALKIIEISTEAIPPEMRGAPVESVNLKVGKLTAVVPDSLRFCFDVATKDTPLAGARLNIEQTPIVVRCRECGADTTIDEARFACGECSGGDLEILSGRELTVASIEMAESGQGPPAKE